MSLSLFQPDNSIETSRGWKKEEQGEWKSSSNLYFFLKMETSALVWRLNTHFSNLPSPTYDSPIPILSSTSKDTILCTQKCNKPQSPPPPPRCRLETRSTTISFKPNQMPPNSNLQEAILSLENESLTVDSRTLTSLLQSCIDTNSITLGRRLHAKIGSIIDSDAFLETKLVSMYAKCGSLVEARKVFDGMRERNLFTWSAMIGGCVREKQWQEVVGLFYQMVVEGCFPDGFLLHRILQACANCQDLETGMVLHSIALRCGFLESSVRDHIGNSILAMYIRCGELKLARRFFEKLRTKDLVAWNSMISGYCHSGENEEASRLLEMMQSSGIKLGVVTWNILITSYNQSGNPDKAMDMMKKMEQSGLVPDVFSWTSMISGLANNNQTLQALDLFLDMQLKSVEPNGMTLAMVLSNCASLKVIGNGKEVHSLAVKMGYADTILVGNSLIDMYSKCGRIEDAESVFRRLSDKDIFTWNSMIGGYAQSGYCGKANDLFSRMEDLGVQRNVITWNVMVSGYMQNGDEDQAMELFRRMETDGVGRNTASWNLLISGSLHNGNRNKALGIFRQMQSVCVKPNRVTILSVLPACANITSILKIKEIHACVLHYSLHTEVSVLNSLIDTYAKSGDISSAQSLFDHMSRRDTITWNSLISGYILHRRPKTALDLFNQMRCEEIKPNQVTLASILSAYGLLKMVEEGKDLFSCMAENHKISPGLEHYAAMVDLLGRSGRVEEALEFIMRMPIEPDFMVWSSMFSACRIYGNRTIAEVAAENMVKLNSRNPITHWLLLQSQAVCRRSNTSKLLKLNKDCNHDEARGCCWIEHSKKVLEFSTGERSPFSKPIYTKLDSLEEEIKTVKHSLHEMRLPIEEEEKEATIGTHSEKIAIAFSLMISHTRCRTLRIIKNLRMCFNCHSAAKYISVAYGCEILLKDPTCLHYFKDGQCSCGDYW